MRRGLLPFWRRNRREDLVFVHDNAPIHASRSTREWFSRHQIALLPWPAHSPDLNPIENVWGFMVRKIYANNARFHDVRELKESVIDAWHHVDRKLVENLYSSMDNRIFQLIRRNGGPKSQ